MARVLAGGLEQLSPSARTLIAVGATAGVVFVLLERALPQYKKYIPSAVGLGLGFTLNFSNCLSMFIGAVIALVLQRVRPKVAEDYIVPVSSGIIAGESLIGILIKVLQALHILTG